MTNTFLIAMFFTASYASIPACTDVLELLSKRLVGAALRVCEFFFGFFRLGSLLNSESAKVAVNLSHRGQSSFV